MYAHKISISLPPKEYEFMENYQAIHHFKTRSEVIREALYLLQQKHLERCYSEVSKEVDNDFEITNEDGLENNETW